MSRGSVLQVIFNHSLQHEEGDHDTSSDMDFCKDNPFTITYLDKIFGVLCVIFTIVGVVGNAAAVSYIRNSAKRSITLTIFLHLAITDLFTSLLSSPLSAVIYLNHHRIPCMNPTIWILICNITGVAHSGLARASMFIVTVLSVSRFVAVYRPMSSKRLLGNGRIKFFLVLAWTLAFAISFTPFYFGKPYQYKVFLPTCYFEEGELVANSTIATTGTIYALTSLFPFILPGILVTGCTLAVLLSLSKNSTCAIASPAEEDKCQQRLGCSMEFQTKRHQMKTKKSAAVTTGIILVLFVICYLPWWVNSISFFLVTIQAIPSDTFTGVFTVNGWSYILSVKVLIMVYLNSAANPLIYYTRVFTRGLRRHQAKQRISKAPLNRKDLYFSEHPTLSNISNAITGTRLPGPVISPLNIIYMRQGTVETTIFSNPSCTTPGFEPRTIAEEPSCIVSTSSSSTSFEQVPVQTSCSPRIPFSLTAKKPRINSDPADQILNSTRFLERRTRYKRSLSMGDRAMFFEMPVCQTIKSAWSRSTKKSRDIGKKTRDIGVKSHDIGKKTREVGIVRSQKLSVTSTEAASIVAEEFSFINEISTDD